MLAQLRTWVACWLSGRPHFVIGSASNPYMLRWYVLPRNPWFNVYLHKFLRDDDDCALHDHPWRSLSIVVWGGYIEETDAGKAMYPPGSIIRRSATFRHRVELIGGKPCWTLFITGPRLREWGFHCPKGWVPWQQFVAPHSSGEIGRGCD